MRIRVDERFLEVRFDAPQRTLSWALIGGGFGVHRRVVWHYVRRAELPVDCDPVALLADRLHSRGLDEAVGMLTARDLAPYADASSAAGDAHGRCIATVGLGNALRAGDPVHPAPSVGTINVLAAVDVPLTDIGLIEAVAMVAEARTAALLDRNVPSVVSGLPSTGTGTDCIVVACPPGEQQAYAGKHTAVGHCLGDSVYRAVSAATEVWLTEQQHG